MYPKTRNLTINELVQRGVTTINGDKYLLGRVNVFNSPQSANIFSNLASLY